MSCAAVTIGGWGATGRWSVWCGVWVFPALPQGTHQTAHGAILDRWRGIMRRTQVTYGQLDKVLRSLGFSCRLLKEEPPARVYEHESGALLTTPPFPMTDFVLD